MLKSFFPSIFVFAECVAVCFATMTIMYNLYFNAYEKRRNICFV